MAGGKKQPLQPSNSANIQQTSSNGVKGKTIEETYQKKTQLEHILLRPDTYVGSIEKHTQSLWVYEGNQMVHRSISYVPGLYKIFDEILVNAADNKQRDPSMDSVKVEISVEDNCISVYNNGDGVPVEIHQEEGVYVPEMIFGHLLTSSNYDDSEKKTTGGRNGYGAKLANIFSTEFIIETADGKRQKKYKQVFRSNMGIKSDPVITKCKPGENWTKITFKPDLIKFNMTHLEDDVVSLMRKRVVDIAGCLGKTVKVELNGQRLPVKTFQDYIGLYLQAASKSKPEPLPRIYEKVSDRWEICVSLSDGQFQQVSFVNGIATIKGGSHVDLVSNQITTHVMNIVNKKNKNAAVKAHTIKNHLWIFVNSLIDNPAFDSQTKETLTTRQNSFGSKCELSQELLKKVAKCGVVENILSWADFKQSKDLKKTDGTKRQRLTGITKLDDANDAGGRNSEKCTLILTEGDSAKALAMAGLAVVGRNHYGVFPLRGKLLNVREASHKQIMENAEIQSIKQILGLQHGKEYNSVKSLRYGHLMIMTDQDHDGSHIKGLLINFIHSFWPSLLKIPSFLVEFITPIVKATHKNGRVLSFYTMPEYESWRESLGGSASGWTIKYYKGLGTSTSKEGKEYFKNLAKHKKDFMWINEEDGDAIELAFSKKKIEARKNWLRQFEPGTYLDQTETLIKYSDFVNKELILFSMADLQRSIPSMVDGLKPGQRKILFCSFKRNFVTQAKVAQFSGYVSEHSAYHHGEQSLASTIIGMAQDFVGSNNINLLAPLGQFGTRAQGGKDHASTRYVFTCLSPITRFLFPKEDDVLLDYLNEDGQKIEPTWYAPIIPMVLVNGSEGIGTGWSSFVPNYNPRDIIANIKHMLNDEPLQPMVPWYKGFKGTIEQTSTKDNGVSYTVSGIIEEINETTLRITELPIRKWTQDYKEFLEALMTGNDKIKEPFIRDYKEYNTDTRVHFEVSLSEENMKVALQEGLLKKFRLTTTISTTNMHLFDSKGIIHKYETPEQVLVPFYHLRLELYEKRKKVQLENLQLELLKLDNKVRFILGVVNGEIIVNNRKRADLLLELKNKGFTPFPKKGKPVEAAIAGAIPEVEESPEDNIETAKGVRAGDYEYLLSMAIGTLTLEKVQQLCAERDKVEDDVEELKKATPKSLWCKDLDAFIRELEGQELQEAKDDEYELSNMGSDAARIFRQVGKNQKKTTKKTVTAEKADSQSTTNNQASTVSVSTSNAQKETAKPNEGGGGKKGAAKKQMEVENDGDDELDTSLQDRLAAYNNGLSADQSAIEDQGSMQSSQNENLKPKQKEPTRREKKAAPIYVDMSDEEEDKIGTVPEEEYEEEGEKQLRQVGTKGKKAANGRRKAMVVSDSDSDFGIEDAESDYEEALPKESKKLAADEVTKPSKINPTKSSNGRIRKAMVVSDSDSDYGIEDAESDYEEALPKESKKLAADKTTKPSKINPTKSSNGRRRKAMVVSDSDSDFGIEDAESDYEETLPKESKELAESDYEETLPKESKELAADKATKPSKINPTKSTSTTTAPVPTKRGPKRASQGQKLIDEMLKPSTSDDDAVHIVQPSPYRKSPENEIRKKKPSPFNNKSGSIMSNLRQGSQTSPPSANGSVGSSSNSPEEVNEVPKPAGGRRPQRANQAPVQYVLSESSDEDYENEVEITDSDFAEDDD